MSTALFTTTQPPIGNQTNLINFNFLLQILAVWFVSDAKIVKPESQSTILKMKSAAHVKLLKLSYTFPIQFNISWASSIYACDPADFKSYKITGLP